MPKSLTTVFRGLQKCRLWNHFIRPTVTKQLLAVGRHWQNCLCPEQQAEGSQGMLPWLLRGILSPLRAFPWIQGMEQISVHGWTHPWCSWVAIRMQKRKQSIAEGFLLHRYNLSVHKMWLLHCCSLYIAWSNPRPWMRKEFKCLWGFAREELG